MGIDKAAILGLLKTFGPILLSTLVPGAGGLLAPIIAGAIQSAEELHNASGPEKKAHALELVEAGAAAANVVAKKTLIEPAQARAIADPAIDTAVQVINVVHAAQAAQP